MGNRIALMRVNKQALEDRILLFLFGGPVIDRSRTIADALLFPDNARITAVLDAAPVQYRAEDYVYLRIECPTLQEVPDGAPVPCVQALYAEKHHGPHKKMVFVGWTYEDPQPKYPVVAGQPPAEPVHRPRTWRDEPPML